MRFPIRSKLAAALAVPLVALVVMNYVGDAPAPTPVDSHPALLITLNARTRNLASVVLMPAGGVQTYERMPAVRPAVIVVYLAPPSAE